MVDGWGIFGDSTKGNTGETNVTIENATVNGDVYGGGYAGTSGSTNITVINSTVNNVYGGGNAAEITNTTNTKITSSTIKNGAYAGGKGETATVYGDSYITVDGTTSIEESLYGGGNAAMTGIEGNTAKCYVYVYQGNIKGDVYGGANTSVVTGETHVTVGIGDSTIEGVQSGDINISGTVFGGGKSNSAGSETYDYSFISVYGDTYIDVNAKNNVINIGKSVFGAGNAATIEGNGYINISNYGTKETPKPLVSIQRATDVTIDNSVLKIAGTTDRTNALSNVIYTINRTKDLILKNNTVLYLASGANLLEGLESKDSDGNLEKEKGKNTDNRIYLLQGKNIILSKENGAYGVLKGNVFVGKYILTNNEIDTYVFGFDYHHGDEVVNYDKEYFFKNSYAQTTQDSDIETNGFFTNNIVKDETTGKDYVDLDYIEPETVSASYRWMIGEVSNNIYYEDNELIASKYTSTAQINLNLPDVNQPYMLLSVQSFELTDVHKDGMKLKEPSTIPNIAETTITANTEFALTMQTGIQGWKANGSTSYLYDENGGIKKVEGTEDYYHDNSTTTPSLIFNLVHSKNITQTKDLGTITIKMKAEYLVNVDELKSLNIYVVIKLGTNNASKTMDYYEGAVSPGVKYSSFPGITTNITDKSSFSSYYSIYINEFDQKYGDDYSTYYHCLKFSDNIPEGTKITMIDTSTSNKKYYYYIVKGTDKNRILFTDFIKMGTKSEYYDQDSSYYNKTGKYVMEEFVFQFDFSNTTINSDLLNNNVLLQLRNKNDTEEDPAVFSVNTDIYPMLYSVYTDAKALASVDTTTPKTSLYKVDDIKIDMDVTYAYQYKDKNIVYDTTQLDNIEAWKVSIYEGATKLGYEDISTISVTYKDVDYYTKKDGSIIFPVTDVVSNIKDSFVLNLTQKEDWKENQTYTILVEAIGATKSLYEISSIANDSVNIVFMNEEYGLNANIDAKSQLIDATTGRTMDETNTVHLDVEYQGEYENAKIKVALARRDYSSVVSANYINVDLQDYVTNSLGTGSSNYEYTIFDNPKSTQSIDLKMKEKITPGSYKLKFILYDGDNYIGEMYKMIIIK